MSSPMPKTSFAEKLMAVPSRALYLVLAIVIIISVFLSRPLPNQPNQPAAVSRRRPTSTAWRSVRRPSVTSPLA